MGNEIGLYDCVETLIDLECPWPKITIPAGSHGAVVEQLNTDDENWLMIEIFKDEKTVGLLQARTHQVRKLPQ